MQHIIVFIIILAAVAWVLRSVIRSLKTKNSSRCDGCSGCDLKDLYSKTMEEGMKQRRDSLKC